LVLSGNFNWRSYRYHLFDGRLYTNILPPLVEESEGVPNTKNHSNILLFMIITSCHKNVWLILLEG